MAENEALCVAQMERAFAARDRLYDGRFVVGVVSTGIFCRPSCPARRPLPHNIRFFVSGEQAQEAGFRPCKRCQPECVSKDAAAVELALSLLQASQKRVGLADLAKQCGYSSSHLQRIFTRATGLSPAAYGRALREERARAALSASGDVTQAIYRAGFEAPSRFYDGLEGKLGMTPSAWVKGGAGVTICWAVAQTSLGALLVAATAKGVCRLSFNEDEAALRARFPKAALERGGKEFGALVQQVVDAVEMPGTGHDIPLDVVGTAFQQRVWDELKRIPAGETRSYGELASALGKPSASRAVGGANGANPVAVLVPCHRVVQADGSLGGYAYGGEIKAELLRREGRGSSEP